MKAMILAAGLGTRMRPRTESLPKALVPVAGRPLIHYSLHWLRGQGLREVIVNTHYLAEMVEREVGDGSRFGLKIIYSREDELLGTGGGIGKARRFFGRERLVVANADTVLDADIEEMIERHEKTGAIATMALVEEKEPGAYTSIKVDSSLMVKSIGGKPDLPDRSVGPTEDQAKNMTFTGLSILEPALVDYLPADRFAHLAADALIPALAQGKKIAGYHHRGYWKAVDDMERAKEVEADLQSGSWAPRFFEPTTR